MSAVCLRPGCENPIEQPQSGGRRKWCSERCRKRQYDGECIDCGARVDGTSPGSKGGRCLPCGHAAIDRASIPRNVAARARRELVVERWARGDSLLMIAEEFGFTRGYVAVEICRMRGLGYDLPYRRKPKAAS